MKLNSNEQYYHRSRILAFANGSTDRWTRSWWLLGVAPFTVACVAAVVARSDKLSVVHPK